MQKDRVSSYLVLDAKEKYTMKRYSQMCKVSIEASEVSDLQGLDPNENIQAFREHGGMC